MPCALIAQQSINAMICLFKGTPDAASGQWHTTAEDEQA